MNTLEITEFYMKMVNAKYMRIPFQQKPSDHPSFLLLFEVLSRPNVNVELYACPLDICHLGHLITYLVTGMGEKTGNLS